MKIPEKITNLISERVTDKNRFYMIGGVLLVIFLLVILFQVKLLMSLSPKIETLSKDLKEARDNIARLGQFQQEVEKIGGKIKLLHERIPSKEQIPVIMENIAVIAKASGVKINQLVPLRESQDLVLTNEDAKYYTFPILVHGRAGYHDFGNFFSKIENDNILMSIVDFDIAASNENSMQHSLNMVVQVFLREEVE